MDENTNPNPHNYILIIEDDEFYAKIYQRQLKEAGLDVVLISQAQDAINYAQKNIPRLIISDLIMPQMDGFKFLELVKKDPILKDIPVLVFSNLGQDRDIQEATRLGAAGYIIKIGVSLHEAVAKIKEFYNKAQPVNS